ncbi:MAG: heme-binding protein [Terracoccus sp.]
MATEHVNTQESLTAVAVGGTTRRAALGYAALAAAAVGVTTADGAEAATGTSSKGPLELKSVSQAQAERVLAAAVRHIRRNNLPPMFVTVVDAFGDEKATVRMDGNGGASLLLAPPKARTSAAFRTATATLAANTTDPGRIASFTTAGFSLLGGGVPLVHDGTVIGAVGVGGGSPEQDHAVATAGAAAL